MQGEGGVKKGQSYVHVEVKKVCSMYVRTYVQQKEKVWNFRCPFRDNLVFQNQFVTKYVVCYKLLRK